MRELILLENWVWGNLKGHLAQHYIFYIRKSWRMEVVQAVVVSSSSATDALERLISWQEKTNNSFPPSGSASTRLAWCSFFFHLTALKNAAYI